jgi:hypothetical protein
MNATSKEQIRVVCWFSCGAASAVAAKLALAKHPDAVVAYCWVKEEHPDNMRFLRDCERWFGREITVLKNEKYEGSVDVVNLRNRYLVGPAGAKCTKELKKIPREAFQRHDDLHVFGYTAEEQERVDRFIDANADVQLWCPLVDAGLGKSDCLALVEQAGIELPAMYRLGYNNANCIGCVKGGAGYWNKIRRDFPERFEQMAKIEEQLGRTVLRRNGQPYSLRMLKLDEGHPVKDLPASCGIACEHPDVMRSMGNTWEDEEP